MSRFSWWHRTTQRGLRILDELASAFSPSHDTTISAVTSFLVRSLEQKEKERNFFLNIHSTLNTWRYIYRPSNPPYPQWPIMYLFSVSLSSLSSMSCFRWKVIPWKNFPKSPPFHEGTSSSFKSSSVDSTSFVFARFGDFRSSSISSLALTLLRSRLSMFFSSRCRFLCRPLSLPLPTSCPALEAKVLF